MHNRRIFLALLLVVTLLYTVLSVAATGGVALADGKPHKPKVNCFLKVPQDALSAQGLATPWVLSSGNIRCHESDPNAAVFVQATIFSPSTKQFFVYSPLVIDKGTQPAIAPVVPTLPADAIVAIFGGGNDATTRLVGASKQCVNGSPGVFGQVFFCNAGPFFQAVNASGVTIPALGTASDGLPCPTVRDWMVVDQDQSDNVQTTYLVDAHGRTAQNTAANEATLVNYLVQANGSDNALLTNFIDKSLGCSAWTVPDLANNGAPAESQALDELQAAAYQAAPQALVPAADDMTLTPGGRPDVHKADLYRENIDQPLAANSDQANTMDYCLNLISLGIPRLVADRFVFAGFPSAIPSVGDNLWTLLAARLDNTLAAPVGTGLGCVGTVDKPGGLLHMKDPIHLTLDGDGVAVAATIKL